MLYVISCHLARSTDLGPLRWPCNLAGLTVAWYAIDLGRPYAVQWHRSTRLAALCIFVPRQRQGLANAWV